MLQNSPSPINNKQEDTTQGVVRHEQSKLTFKQKRKQDAQELAELIYDMFMEEEASNKNEAEGSK